MIGGNAALDFINTVSDWQGEPVDRLDGALGFGAWAGVAGLLDQEDCAHLKRDVERDPKAAAKFYAGASQLRAALWRVFSAIEMGAVVAENDLALLDDWKVRSSGHCRIVADSDGFRRRCRDEAPAMERAMRMIVEAAEDLLLDGRLDRLHSCDGADCKWMFLGLSKNGRRRWCSMATCGNDHKVAKFRKRNKKAAA